VAQRREELRSRVAMQRINLYAPQVEVISTQEDAAAASAGGEFAQALVGF